MPLARDRIALLSCVAFLACVGVRAGGQGPTGGAGADGQRKAVDAGGPAAKPAAADPCDQLIIEKAFAKIQDPGLKKAVQGFAVGPKGLTKAYSPEFGLREVCDAPDFDDAAGVPDPDARRKMRFLHPQNPRSQPLPKGANLWRYTGVDGVQALRPQNRPEPTVIANGEGTEPGYRFRYLPDVAAPGTIDVTYIRTAPGLFPKVDPWRNPPGTNFLPTVFSNAFDLLTQEMPNTLASTPYIPFNLHAAPRGQKSTPDVRPLASRNSPVDDLRTILEKVYESLTNRQYRDLWQELDRPKRLIDHFRNPPLEKGETPKDYFERVRRGHVERIRKDANLLKHHLRWAVDIIEGNQGPDTLIPSSRSYRGFPLLHHSGHYRVKRVQPVFDGDGNVVGGNLDVHMIYYGGRIENDTMYIDFGDDDKYLPDKERQKKPKPIPADATWTVTYTIDVLNRGNDDFSTMALHTSHFPADATKKAEEDRKKGVPPPAKPLPAPFFDLGMDQTFFPMSDGTRTVLTLNMVPRKYYALNYTWGWRNHPPRTQAAENAGLPAPPVTASAILYTRRPNHERWVFSGYDKDHDVTEEEYRQALTDSGEDPAKWPSYAERVEELTQLFPKVARDGAIKSPYDRISDLAPEKRMWRAFKDALNEAERLLDTDHPEKQAARALHSGGGLDTREDPLLTALRNLLDAQNAYLDWQDRLSLPSGLEPDPDTDLTLLYVNNTIYGQFSKGGWTQHPSWRTREADEIKHTDNVIKITLLNGDYFPHGYLNLDFGGNRGWENQFKSSLASGGSGPFFTFGRFHLYLNSPLGWVAAGPAVLMEDDPGGGRRPAILRDKDGNAIKRKQLSADELDRHRITDVDQPIYDGRLPVAVQPSVHRLMIEHNFEPSRRLRFYNFDPLHHDVAIFPVH